MSVRGIVVLLVAVTAAWSTTGCGADAPPSEQSIGQVERNATVTATGLALVTKGEGVARLVGRLVNDADRPDRLLGLDVDTELGPHSVIIADAPLLLRPGESFELARDGEVSVISDKLRQGYRVELSLVFANSAPIVTTVAVESQTGPYADVEVRRPPDGEIAP